MTETTRVVRLVRRPTTGVAAEDFEVAEAPLPELGEGEVLVRNTWMSIDPYVRLSLTAQPGPHKPVELGATLAGAAIGVVEQSNAPALPVGASVLSHSGWRDRFVAKAAMLRQVDASASPNLLLGALGVPGITAYVGIEEVLRPQAGETIFISAAAGAVGSIACQLARRRGARVLASAGSERKLRWLTEELGVDAAVNYRTQDLDAFLTEHAPGGLDIYFDNVGGEALDAALRALKPFGRIGLCGAIARYNTDDYRAGPADFFTIVEKCLAVTGFNVTQWMAKAGAEVTGKLSALLASGEVVLPETVVEGLENAPAAFAGVFGGDHVGKLLVRL
jgi:hypothetical protein